ARRIQMFDTVLPDEVRVEFTRLKRPRILDRLESPDGNTLWLAGAIVFGAIILALAMGLTGRHEAQQLVPSVSAVPGMPVQQPPATREPTPVATPTQTAVARLAPYAPRAERVRFSPPRAQLIRLPEWRIGEERSVMMPYGLKVAARLKGKLPTTDMLPMS